MNYLTRTIINHSTNHSKRVDIAREMDPIRRFQRWSTFIWFEALAYRRSFGVPLTVEQLTQSVCELDTYYIDYLAEMGD